MSKPIGTPGHFSRSRGPATVRRPGELGPPQDPKPSILDQIRPLPLITSPPCPPSLLNNSNRLALELPGGAIASASCIPSSSTAFLGRDLAAPASFCRGRLSCSSDNALLAPSASCSLVGTGAAEDGVW